jgi:hypothetical protein
MHNKTVPICVFPTIFCYNLVDIACDSFLSTALLIILAIKTIAGTPFGLLQQSVNKINDFCWKNPIKIPLLVRWRFYSFVRLNNAARS